MDGPPTRSITPAGIRVNIIVLAFTLVTGIIVFLRMFTRLIMTQGAGLEDASIALAMTASIVLAITIADQAVHGLGEHTQHLSVHDGNRVSRAFWASIWVYNLALLLTKVSILIQYLRIFPIAWFRRACFGMLGLVIAYGSWAVGSSIFICSPVAYSWDRTIPHGQCLNEMVIWFTNAGMNIAEDIVILLLPMPVIQTLHMAKGQKQALIIMLLLGTSVTVVSIVRLYSLDTIANSTDVAWGNVAHATLSAVEVNVGIMCACLPAMRPLFALIVPKYFSAVPHFDSKAVVDIQKLSALPTLPRSGKNTSQTSDPRAGTPQGISRSTIPRPSPGHSAIHGNDNLYTRQQSSGKHSRSGSNMSIDGARVRPPAARWPVLVSNRPHIPYQHGQNALIHSQPVSNMSVDRLGLFPFSAGSRAHTPLSNTIKHSRSTSNITVNTKLATAQPSRFQGRLDPLRMSPVSPPANMRSFSPYSPFEHPRSLSEIRGHVRSSSVPPNMPGSVKPLPLTPFPAVQEV